MSNCKNTYYSELQKTNTKCLQNHYLYIERICHALESTCTTQKDLQEFWKGVKCFLMDWFGIRLNKILLYILEVLSSNGRKRSTLFESHSDD
jgi:hypothetical protein